MGYKSVPQWMMILLVSATLPAWSQEPPRPPRGPALTEEQKTCVEKHRSENFLEEDQPSREEMEEILVKCKVGKSLDKKEKTKNAKKTEAASCAECLAENEKRLNQLEAQIQQIQMLMMMQKNQSQMSTAGGMSPSSLSGMSTPGMMSALNPMGMMGGYGMMGNRGMMNSLGMIGSMNSLSSMMSPYSMGSLYLGGMGSWGGTSPYLNMSLTGFRGGSNLGTSVLPRISNGTGVSTLPVMNPYWSGAGMSYRNNLATPFYWRGY